jgi:hypothetical protein
MSIQPLTRCDDTLFEMSPTIALDDKLESRRRASAFLYGLSSTLFFLAWTASILDFLPIIMLREAGFMACYVCRILGYAAWKGYIYSYFSEQNLLAAMGEENGKTVSRSIAHQINVRALQKDKYAAAIGVVACVSIILYLACPAVSVPALAVGLWALALSNGFWSKGCCEKVSDLKRLNLNFNPSDADKLALQQERAYRNYTIFLTAASVFFAAALTLSLCGTPIGTVLGLALFAGLTVKSGIGSAIGAGAVFYLFKSYWLKSKSNKTAEPIHANATFFNKGAPPQNSKKINNHGPVNPIKVY